MNFPSMRVDDKVAFVTGSGGGIGEAAATALAAAGADIVISELPHLAERAEGVARSIVQQTGRRAIVQLLDVTKVDSINGAVARAIDHYGRIDILVNSAGVNRSKFAVDVTEEDWDFVVDINLKGLFFCCQAVGCQMIKQRAGKIVNIASINGVVAYYKRAAYCSSKAGAVNLTRVLAIERGAPPRQRQRHRSHLHRDRAGHAHPLRLRRTTTSSVGRQWAEPAR